MRVLKLRPSGPECAGSGLNGMEANDKVSTMITTRQARAGDVTAILRLFRELDQLHAEALPAYFQVPEPSQLTPEELAQVSNDSQQYLLLAIDQDAVVGVVFARLEEEPAAATSILRPRHLCWVRKLIITHSYRGRGIGRQLMHHVEQWALQQ